jgi:FkbM family methyltransferase
MKRFLKQHFGRFLPEVVRTSFKQRAQARFNAPVEGSLVVEQMETSLRCTIDPPQDGFAVANNGWSFLAPLACQDQLHDFAATPDGRAELYSIARAARSSGGVLFDVGAHSGVISALFCAANPQNQVFSFEPSPILSERLWEMRRLNGFGDRMHIEEIGIGEVTKTVEMLLDPAGGFVQVQRFDHTMWAAPEPIRISIERLSDAAARLHVVPQFVKLDVEGYEHEAIAGSLEFLKQHQPTIFLELHLNYLDQRRLSARVVVEMLGRCGYRFYTSSGSPLRPRQLYDSPLPSVHVVAR